MLKEEHRLLREALHEFAATRLAPNAAQWDRDHAFPKEALAELAALGTFGIAVPEEYGGAGMDYTALAVALEEIAAGDGGVSTVVSVNNCPVCAILMGFASEEQKRRLLVPLASGAALGAFCLTEPHVGSNAAALRATATRDGDHYVLNGVKQWITNAGFADVFTVFAKIDGEKFTAFIVDRDTPGVTIGPEERKMGIRGSSTCAVILEDAKVPAANVLGEIGRGHVVAFNILNVGRFKLGAGCVGAAKLVLADGVPYVKQRHQFGRPLADFGLIRRKLAQVAAHTFVAESATYRTAGLLDEAIGRLDKSSDGYDRGIIDAIEGFSIECSMIKVFATEACALAAEECLQMLGGYGYCQEYPLERLYRDERINRIFEGSSEIMRLFIAREAVDRHFSIAGDLVNPKAPLGAKLGALVKSGLFYAWWYPTRFLGWSFWPRYSEFGSLAKHLRYVERTSRRLARATFYAMVRFGPGLERRQAVLGRIVDIGSDLLVMSATVLHAKTLADRGGDSRGAEALADAFCRQARRRISGNFRSLFRNDDVATARVADRFLAGDFAWLEAGVVPLDEYRADAAPGVSGSAAPAAPERTREPVTAG